LFVNKSWKPSRMKVVPSILKMTSQCKPFLRPFVWVDDQLGCCNGLIGLEWCIIMWKFL